MNLFSNQQAGAVFPLLLLSLLVLRVAKRNGFFTLPPIVRLQPITFKHTLGAFLSYLLFTFLLQLSLIIWTQGGKRALPFLWVGWLQLSSLYCIALILVGYLFCIKPQVRHFIFWGEGEKNRRVFLKGIGMGALSWLVCYPSVLFFNLVAGLVAHKFWGEFKLEQVAVKQLKMTLVNPSLFAFMVLAIVTVVPFVEELLFRGFLQNFFKRFLNRIWAIVCSALLFSLVHFAPSQGVGNFQLIFSLLILSFFLGFLYEKTGTLWAPIALHATFNAINIGMILFS